MLITIGVIGKNQQHEGDPVAETTMGAAYEVGRLVAERGGVIVSGGLGGVMAAASKGAKDGGGLTIGFLPSMDVSTANPHVDIAFPTGLGQARNFLTSRGCSVLIMIGGGSGTLNELTIAYSAGRPVVVLRGTGGWSDRIEAALFENRWVDERRTVEVTFADTAQEAVEKAFALAATGSRPGQHI
jgi:uncharacterized protein (TIGR00725 family)